MEENKKYIPPHKRHYPTSSLPLPALPPGTKPTRFHMKNNNYDAKSSGILFAKDCIKKWLVVGLTEDHDNNDSINLSTLTTFERATHSHTLLALVLKENSEEETRREISDNQWIFIAETVKEELTMSLQKVKDLINSSKAGDIKPYLLVRIGKVLFKKHLYRLEHYTRETLERSIGSFYTNVVHSYIQKITHNVVPRIGLELSVEKDFYWIILSDPTQTCHSISCKCIVNKDTNKLQIIKFVGTPVCHFVADVTCLGKNHDLRLILVSKGNSSVTDKKMEKIKDFISFAMFNREVKGGLEWPREKRSCDGHKILEVWHITSWTYRNSLMKFNIRVVDRSDEPDITSEVTLKMTNIVSKLEEDTLDADVAFEMLKENLELIWKELVL